ncbi:hypothetical protein DFH08DRAFT_79388 [Mycena albidolilacea]|uniref:Annexin n=1 Tax=Mycena albidolilacea TaxID=1033008 RepID=A0AAD7EV90_9AGAR|nr:hypothetical protein DFH08DRAFT_79388 [Mycena albidolilacea]
MYMSQLPFPQPTHDSGNYAPPLNPYPPPPPGYQLASYTPPADYAEPRGYSTDNYVPPPSLVLPPSYGEAVEPAIVLYRNTMIHNPKFSGGQLQRYTAIDADIDAILACSKSNSKSRPKGADSRIAALIKTLTQLGPLKMEVVVQEFHTHPNNQKGSILRQFIEDETTGDVQGALFGLIRGPLKYDASRVHYAIKSLPIKEKILHEIFLELTPQELSLLAYVYQQMHKTQMLAHWHKHDVSDENWRLYKAVMHPQRRVLPTQAQNYDARLLMDDVQALHKMQEYTSKEKEKAFTEIFTGRTREHLIQVCRTYREKHNKAMSQVIRSSFLGDYRSALLFIVAGCDEDPRHPETDPQAIRDAKRIEETMVGMGTNKELLAMRVLRAHWSRSRMDRVIAAFPLCNEKHLQLADRVKGEKGGVLSTQGFQDFKLLISALLWDM